MPVFPPKMGLNEPCQKFPFVLGNADLAPERRYAVIIDEAHSSQTGDASDALKKVLDPKGEYHTGNGENDAEPWDYQDEIIHTLEARKAHQPNISFFAFTATPKPKTLIAFGRKGADGKPHEWHLYSMRQAIQEGFILDVLKNQQAQNSTYKPRLRF